MAFENTPPPFGTPQLFLTDSRLALTVVNHLRHQALHRVFGTSPEQDNALTFVLMLGAASSAYETAQRIRGWHPSRWDAELGTVLAREAVVGIGGPGAQAIPGFAALVTFALVGGVALPRLRRAAHRLRVAEHRVRTARIARYAQLRETRETEPYAASAPAATSRS
jgi:hypothetical protein